MGDRESRRRARHRDRIRSQGLARRPRHSTRKGRQLADGGTEEESPEAPPATALSELSQRDEGGGWFGQRLQQLKRPQVQSSPAAESIIRSGADFSLSISPPHYFG